MSHQNKNLHYFQQIDVDKRFRGANTGKDGGWKVFVLVVSTFRSFVDFTYFPSVSQKKKVPLRQEILGIVKWYYQVIDIIVPQRELSNTFYYM